ncbi:proline and serine-rich protein 1 isoform X2 [Chanos chanos]|uniref:Proline and serine-rich protein 1 isoform X2 n=1 Tax=Chanos chanos TaxID=29144 RepID=A0A6J2WW76_CHACN|nr:proline and serine-rich protein 1 isoform X2 [Chanos chanos]
MDKKSFDIVLDEIRKCVLTDQRIKAIEQVHGYFTSEQVIDILKYFSWAEPQIKAVKALQHKMVAIPTTKVANILNTFTFSKDKLIVLELIALNISDAQNYRPVEDLFRVHLSEKKRARRILEQVCKVGCKAPVAMISSCGMIPGNPYPKGKPSQVTGSFPGISAKKDGEEMNAEGKGIASRIIGPSKPAPSTYNPHRPVPYPIPPCRPHPTIAPTYARPASQQNPSSNASTTPTLSPHGSNPSTPVTSQPSAQPQPTTPITPVFPGLVPSQNPVAPSPTPSPAPAQSPSVIKGPPMPAGSPHVAPNPSGQTTPVPPPFPGMPPSGTPTPTVIKAQTPSSTPCGTPVPCTRFSPSPFPGASRSGTSSGAPTPTPRGVTDPLPSQAMSVGAPPYKGLPPSSESQLAPPYPGGPSQSLNQSTSVIRSYTPSGSSGLPPGNSTPGMQGHGGLPTRVIPSPKPPAQQSMGSSTGTFHNEQALSSVSRPGGNSGTNSPVPSAFKGPSRSGTPSLSSLVMPNSAPLARSLGLSHTSGSPQTSLPSQASIGGLQGLPPNLATQPGGSPVPPFPGISPFPSLSSSSAFPSGQAASSVPSMAPAAGPLPPSSSVFSGLVNTGASSPSPFSLGLTTAPSIFPGLPPGPSPAFPSFGSSGPPAAGSPVLSSFMGLPGTSSSVATVATLPAAAVAAAAAAGVPSSSPVLPGFASAFSSNFNPTLVGQAGLSSGLQAPSGATFPGLLSFPGMPGFSPSPSPAALSGLHNPAVQSALLQAHTASALESYPPQPNGFTNYPPAPGSTFPLQPGLHPQLGWQ